jgi:hypothetical protein
MRRDFLSFLVSILLSVLLLPAWGQIAPQPVPVNLGIKAPVCSTDPDSQQSNRFQPYTAESKTISVQTLGNGTTLTRESSEVRAIDSQNRTLNARTEAPVSADQPGFTWGNVNDPVENTQINWNSQTRKAQVFKLPPEAERRGCWQSDSGQMSMSFGPEPGEFPRQRTQSAVAVKAQANIPQPKMEDLGTTTIQGVEAHGQRWTTITPVGQIGNDRELVTTNETWMAVNLGIPLRQVNDSPQGGRTTTEVVRLDLSDPPLSTFQPPEGYEVVTEELHKVACQGSRLP